MDMVLGTQLRSIDNFVMIRQAGALELVILPRSRSRSWLWLVKVEVKAKINVKVKVMVRGKVNDEVKVKVMVLVLDSQVRFPENFVRINQAGAS